MLLKNTIAAIFVLLFLSGCATTPYIAPPTPPSPGVQGIYHRVERGQTLWSIAKAYHTELEEISSINRIQDAANIEVGQLIFIPNRQKIIQPPASYSADDFIWPLRGKIISGFGSPYENMINKGINIIPSGSSEVIASRQGKVVFRADNFGLFGKTVIIDHGDGLSSVYAGNSEVFAKAGDQVRRGAVIARIDASRGDCLHFEIRKAHIAQNPTFYLPR
ncbi:MAG: LysM peptidoglycan-binding domain-containing M23 family metallopeptidase [Candidatus Omnitrophota bacterium]|nr:LysM peptidoglycan-binding domain-containing M23 family metallopeptidase [Candidatus Omnitrophota bacterium]